MGEVVERATHFLPRLGKPHSDTAAVRNGARGPSLPYLMAVRTAKRARVGDDEPHPCECCVRWRASVKARLFELHDEEGDIADMELIDADWIEMIRDFLKTPCTSAIEVRPAKRARADGGKPLVCECCDCWRAVVKSRLFDLRDEDGDIADLELIDADWIEVIQAFLKTPCNVKK